MGGGSGSDTALNAANAQYGHAGAALNMMNPIISSLVSGGYSLPDINQNVFGYLMNPSGTNLSQVSPGLMGFYGNEMTHGLSPSVTGAAFNQNQVNNQQNINSIMNQLGGGTNAGAVMNQLSLNGLMSNAMLGSNLAGMNQQVMQQGAAGLGSTAAGLDQQALQMYMQALSGATGESTTGLSALGNIFGTGTSAGTSLTGMGAQLQDQEGNWMGDLSNLFGGVMSLGTMGSMGINPFAGLSSIFGGHGGGGGISPSPYGAQSSIFNPNNMVNPAGVLGNW